MKKFTESLKSIKKSEKKVLNYYNLFDLLRGLESERPGIKKRVWDWMCTSGQLDSADRPYNGRISYINLFWHGIGDEYPIKFLDKYPEEIEHSKKTWPSAFEGNNVSKKEDIELRMDLNLIWYVYEDEMNEDSIEQFAVLVFW